MRQDIIQFNKGKTCFQLLDSFQIKSILNGRDAGRIAMPVDLLRGRAQCHRSRCGCRRHLRLELEERSLAFARREKT